ncbi:noncanonical pyrimidine nucleotidase, YjjG family protein [Clostridia bacterium]|nr:noncanonical pyrimidine nucleotidase, YjjG family protein [Clostridia bacterium]
MPRYDALLIDADDTLFDFGAAEAASLEETCAQCGVPWLDSTLGGYRVINEEMWRRYERKEIGHMELNAQRFARFFEMCGVEGDSAAFGRAYIKRLGMAGRLLPGALEFIRNVSQVMPVAIVTNGFGPVQRGRLEVSPLAALVRGIVISEEQGTAKPDPRMIRAGMELAGVTDVSRVIMVGDSLENDVGAAKAAGAAACWLNPGQLKARDGLLPDYEIDTLEQLYGILQLDNNALNA